MIVDEFVRTEKEVINQVFVPFLTNPRKPEYLTMTNKERASYPIEPNRQIYLSSIRGADEWSYDLFVDYVNNMASGDSRYAVASVPYHLGVKNGFITKDFIEQFINDNKENLPMVKSELECIPKRMNNNTFYKFSSINKNRTSVRALTAMSNEEYVQYKNCRDKWAFYQPKLPNELRIMAVDIALIESANNDNTAIWIIRMIKDGDAYKKIASYCESMHGVNSLVQEKRIKQLFYEMDCDYCAIDTQGELLPNFIEI